MNQKKKRPFPPAPLPKTPSPKWLEREKYRDAFESRMGNFLKVEALLVYLQKLAIKTSIGYDQIVCDALEAIDRGTDAADLEHELFGKYGIRENFSDLKFPGDWLAMKTKTLAERRKEAERTKFFCKFMESTGNYILSQRLAEKLESLSEKYNLPISEVWVEADDLLSRGANVTYILNHIGKKYGKDEICQLTAFMDDPLPPHSKERLLELESLSYKEYLFTPEWQAKREAKIKEANRCCQLCGVRLSFNSSFPPVIHHRTYERVRNESLYDLIVLCRDCHELFHKHGVLADSDGFKKE